MFFYWPRKRIFGAILGKLIFPDFAIKARERQHVDTLYEMGISDTQLAVAIVGRNSVETKRLIDVISDIDFQTKKRCTALYTAVECNNIEAAAMLLERGASMNIMPKKRIFQNASECPILLALKMGESHEEMQLLLLEKLASVQSTWSSTKDMEILETIPLSAMLYSTPLVFFRATVESRGKELFSRRGQNVLMTTLKQVVLFSNDAAKCTKTLENVVQIVNEYPDMAWERLKKDEECGLLMHTKNSTALGMVVYQTTSVRESKNRQFEMISRGLLQLRTILETAGGGVSASLADCNEKVESDIDNNSKVMCYVLDEFVPALWTIMLRPLRIALCMATHARLGSSKGCCASCLNTDLIDIIFSIVVLDVTIAPHLVRSMLC